MTKTARLYGGSLYDLAVSEGIADELMEQSGQIRQLFKENPDYLKLLSEPSLALEERKGLIDAAFGESAEKYLVNFIKLLCEKGYLGEYAGCCDEYARRYNADHHITQAVVTSAIALTDAQMTALKEKLSAISGKKVYLTNQVNPGVIGGLRVEMDGQELDGTVQGRLTGISRRLDDITL